MAATKKAVKKAPAKKVPAAKPNARGQGLDPEKGLGKKLAARTEDTLRPSSRKRRDVFIAEYMFDFCASRAWRRMKATLDPDDPKVYNAREAAEHGYEMLNEAYVQLRVREVVDTMQQADMLNANRVLAMAIREANYQGTGAQHGGRVAAIKLLADVLDMTSGARAAQVKAAPDRSAAVRGGVMVVPETGTLQGWEARAKAAQTKLKEDVRK